MDQKTAESFNVHNVLFQEAISDGTIKLCIWDRSGTTLDTALPGLRDMIEGIDDWQAVVITGEEQEDELYEHAPDNPFDFCVNGKAPEYGESDNPIIRLSHFLGGVPYPKTGFTPKTVTLPDKEPRVVYVPESEDEDKKERYEELNRKYEELSKKYDFDGIRPYQILMIAPLLVEKTEESNTDYAWRYKVKELHSSEFWSRNGYSSSCRFLKFEYDRTGKLNRARQKLKFWLSVLLLSINEIDPSALQAYRLYDLNLQLDTENLGLEFQNEISRVTKVKHAVEKEIRMIMDGSTIISGGLPNMKREVSLSTDETGEDPELPYNRLRFSLFRNNMDGEIGKWDDFCGEREAYYREMVKRTDRKLDMTACRAKDMTSIKTAEVEGLSKYQIEDMNNSADSCFSGILDKQGRLPDLNTMDSDELKSSKNDVTSELRRRLGFTPVLISLISAAVLFILCFIPDFFLNLDDHTEVISVYVIMEILFVVIGAAVCMFLFRNKLYDLIDKYRELIKVALSRLTGNKEEYEGYIGDYVTYARTRNYIKAIEKKAEEDRRECDRLRQIINKTDEYIDKLIAWGKAFGVGLDGYLENVDDEVVDKSVLHNSRELLRLHYSSDYPIELNRSGEMISSPFRFIKRIEITREELYEASN